MNFPKELLTRLAPLLPPDSCWVVGGAVRDRLLGRETVDIDLIVPTNPTELANKIASRLNGHAFSLDKERGVTRVAFDNDLHIDLAMFQGKSFEEDLNRRDFTINALAVPFHAWLTPQWKRKVVDLNRGLPDLNARVIRLIQKNVFTEDPLRLLRAFRISAELDFKIEPTTQKLIKKQCRLLKKPAPERIREEILRLFSVQSSHPHVVLMDKLGILEVMLPEAKNLRKTGHSYYGPQGVMQHTLDSLKMLESVFDSLRSWFGKAAPEIQTYLEEVITGYKRSAHLKWAIILHDIGKPKTAKVIDGRLRFFEHEHVGADMVEKMGKRFRWSSEETSRYSKLVRHHMRPGNLATHEKATDRAFHRFFRDLEDDGVAMLLVSLGDHLSYLTPRQLKMRSTPHEKLTQKMVRRFYFEKEKINPPKLLSGYDVMKKLNLPPSPLIGQLLRELMEAQSEGKIKSKNDAFQFLLSRLAEIQKEKPVG